MLYFPPSTSEVEIVQYDKFQQLDIYNEISAVTMAEEVARVTGYSVSLKKNPGIYPVDCPREANLPRSVNVGRGYFRGVFTPSFFTSFPLCSHEKSNFLVHSLYGMGNIWENKF
jgi:hypothetical protein